MASPSLRERKWNYAYLDLSIKLNASEGFDCTSTSAHAAETQGDPELFYSSITEILKMYGAGHVGRILTAPSPVLEVGFDCELKLKQFQECLRSGKVLDKINSKDSKQFDVSIGLMHGGIAATLAPAEEVSTLDEWRQGNLDVEVLLGKRQENYMPNHLELLRELKDINRWHYFGTHLKVPENELQKIKINNQANVEQCKNDLVSYLCKCEYTWPKIVTALQEIDEMKTARKIINDYKLDITLSTDSKKKRLQEPSSESDIDDDGQTAADHGHVKKKRKTSEVEAFLTDICTCQCAKEFNDFLQKELREHKMEKLELKHRLDCELKRQQSQANEEITYLRIENQQLRSALHQQYRTPAQQQTMSDSAPSAIENGESDISFYQSGQR